jgi:hypothetical protein
VAQEEHRRATELYTALLADYGPPLPAAQPPPAAAAEGALPPPPPPPDLDASASSSAAAGASDGDDAHHHAQAAEEPPPRRRRSVTGVGVGHRVCLSRQGVAAATAQAVGGGGGGCAWPLLSACLFVWLSATAKKQRDRVASALWKMRILASAPLRSRMLQPHQQAVR